MNVPLFESDITIYERPDGITVIRRHVFANEHFDYEKGDHVVYAGPSTRGKTTLAFDLLEPICTPEFPAFIPVSKPQDPVTAQRGAELGFRRVDEWPPPPLVKELLGGKKPPGYLIWPRFGNMETDIQRAADITERLLADRYSHGASRKNKGGILVMDDTMVKAKIQGNDQSMVTVLAMASAMKLGMWTFIQKPTDSGRTTLWSYEQAKHLFISKGGDAAMMRRYKEIIGENGAMAVQILPTLKPFQFLYLDRIEGHLCIVDSE